MSDWKPAGPGGTFETEARPVATARSSGLRLVPAPSDPASVATASVRPRRRWYDRIPTWRWVSVIAASLAGAAVSIHLVGTGMVAFLLVTTLFVLVPPACVVAVVTLLISAWRSTSWRQRIASAVLAALPALLLYKCATAYDRVMELFFAGQR